MRKSDLVKSLTRVINNKGLLILCLSIAVLGVEEVYGGGSSYTVNVEASPKGKGTVYVNDKLEESKNYNDNTKTFIWNLRATPSDNYTFKKWDLVGAGEIDDTLSLTTKITNAAEAKNTQYKATVTAIFARMTTDVQSIAFDEKNVGTPYSSNITLITGNAGTVTITLENKIGNYFSIEGDIETYPSGGTEDTTNIVVNYEPKAAGTHSATLQITGSNGMTTINIPLSGSAKSMGEMSWKPNTNVMNIGDLLTEENLTYSDGSRQIVFTTDDSAVVKINKSGYPEAVGVGTANITAKQDTDASWYETSATQEVLVTNKQKQTITWDDDLTFKFTGATITQPLTATAESGMAVTYSPTSGSFFTIENGQLKITGIGEAQLTATQAGNEDWVGVSLTRRLVSRDPNATCDDPIYEGGEHTLKTIDSWEQDISSYGEPRTIQFKAKKTSGSLGDGIILHQFYDGDWHEVKNIARGDLGTNYQSFGPYNLNRNTTKIKFFTEVGSTLHRDFKDIYITRAKYLESQTKAIDFGNVGFGNSVPRTFSIDYSNIQGPLVTSCNDSCYTISPTEIGSDCGDYQKNVTVTVTFHASAAGEQKGRIHLTDEKVDRGGLELYIDVTANVTKTAQDINWNDPTTFKSTDKPTLSATATSGLTISSYSSDNENIAKVINGNQLEFYGSDKVNITARQDGNDFYESASLTKEFTINKVTPTISTNPTATALTYGQKLSESSLASGAAKVNPFRGEAVDHLVTGSFAWTNGEYVVVEAGGTHEYDVTFTPSGTEAGMYNTVSGKATVTVNKATPTLTAKNEEDLEVYVNDTQTPKLNLVDYITDYSAESDTYGHTQTKSAITYACNQDGAVIEGNKFYATKAGTYTITATAPATDYYNSQTTTFTIKANNYYYSQAKSIVATNTITGKDGGWASVWQGNTDSASIGEGSWLHEDKTSSPKRLKETTHPYYFRAKVGTGYTFAGWFTSADAAEAEYKEPTYNGNFTISSRDRENITWVTRYAKFTPITYTVKFVGNGNTGGSMSDQILTYDVAQNLTANAFVRTGWSFTGWKDDNGNTYTNGQEVTNLASSQGATITMTAQWSQDTYTVTLDPNGCGTGGTEQIEVRYNEDIPTSITPPTPTDPAYIFLGYYLDVADENTKYYDADGIAVSGKKWPFTEGKTLKAKWQTGDYIKSWNVAESYTAQSNIPYDIAKSFSGGPVTYSIEGTDEGVITINNESKYIYANKKGMVTIKACPIPAGDITEVSCDTYTLTVVGKKQMLDWGQSFVFTTRQDGGIDETIPLTATAIDTIGNVTGNPVWYSVENTNMAEIIGDATNGYSLHVKSYGSNGVTTITAHVNSSEFYESGELEFPIRIYKFGEKCHPLVMTYPNETNLGNMYKDLAIGSGKFSGAPVDSLFLQIKRSSFTTGQMQIYAKNENVEVFGKNFTKDEISTSYQTYGFALSSEHINSLELTSKSAISYTVKDIRITQKSYLRTDINKSGDYYPISAGIFVMENYSKQFDISYSAKHQVVWKITNTSKQNDWNLRVVSHNKRNQQVSDYTNDCDDWGTYKLEISAAHVWMTQEDIKDTITIYTSDGDDAIVIPIHLIVGLGSLYQFTGGADQNWNNLANWVKEGSSSSPTSLPDMRNKVEIWAPIRITEPVTVYGLTIKENTATKGSVTIAPTGGLTVYNGGVTNLDESLTIESSRDNQGFFRMSPDVSAIMIPMPIATIQLATRSTLDDGANDDAVWQYIGTPVKTYDKSEKQILDGYEFTVDYITWLYEWSEPEGWIDMKNVPQPVKLKPFTGYAITQYGQPTYEFIGQMMNNNVRIPLTYTESGMSGDNVIANSYAAPIDVTLVDQTDFEGNVIQAFYVFNSGSWNQWKQNNTGNGVQAGSLANYTPGQYIAIPTSSGAELGEDELTMIAPMQGFDIYTTEKGKTAYFNLNYRKHVWNATNVSGQMNEPLRAPKADDTYMSDDVARQYATWDSINAAKKARIDAITHRVRLIAYGENSGNDRVIILESPLYAKQYENGADAPKMFAETEGLLGLYTNEVDCGLMSVNATNSVDGMFVGFRAGADNQYVLSASNVIGKALQLVDMETMQTIELKDSAQFVFAAEPYSQNDFRFQIVNPELHGGEQPTGWNGLGEQTKIWYSKQIIYISNASVHCVAEVFTAAGELIKQVIFNNNTTISTEDMPEGVYAVRVEGNVLKFFVKH